MIDRTLEVEARRILEIAGPDRCVVWADVVRPDSFGDGMAAANDALARAWNGHPNVVTVYDVGEHAGRIYFAMELVDGTTLRRWLAFERHGWRTILISKSL